MSWEWRGNGGKSLYISTLFSLYIYIDITLSQAPSWDDGSHRHLIRVMTFSPFSPFGPGSPGTPSSPTGPGKPGFPWKGKYIITSFFSQLLVTNHTKEKSAETQAEKYIS